MGFTSWLYTNSKKNLRVKIVHPGGHAELHDRPVLAAEIIRRNPRCCVAYPNVFKQPFAIIQPDDLIMPGQKVYIVPTSTIRKLQKLSLKYSPSVALEARNGQGVIPEGEEEPRRDSGCWSMEEMDSTCGNSFKVGSGLEDKNCFLCMFKRMKSKSDSGKEEAESSCGSLGSSSEQRKMINRKKANEMAKKGGSPNKLISSLDYWQPSLHSIVEERVVQD